MFEQAIDAVVRHVITALLQEVMPTTLERPKDLCKCLNAGVVHVIGGGAWRESEGQQLNNYPVQMSMQLPENQRLVGVGDHGADVDGGLAHTSLHRLFPLAGLESLRYLDAKAMMGSWPESCPLPLRCPWLSEQE